MIIRNNTGGRRTARYLGTTQSAIGKTLEKLSSGYRINRSADDAAGLAISEKMRLNITGLGRARLNSMEGTKLIQTGEGALQEIQDMLDRAEYMATQSANGTYEDELDRENLQKELDHICSEIDRIAKGAKFNTIELFQDVGLEGERGFPEGAGSRQLLETAASAATREAANMQTAEGGLTLDQVRRNTKPGEFNIIYMESDFVTTQNPTNTITTSSGTVTYDPGTDDSALNLPVDGTGKNLKDVLKEQIVPQTVKNLLSSYPAFGYLKDSNIGIGLRLYNDPRSQVAASVTGGVGGSNMQIYMLSVNVARIKDGTDGTIKDASRTKLEATIAHEMIHAFMYEASTAGMLSNADRFPDWFVEGMAQTASGPDNWVKMPEKVTNPDGSVTTITYGGLQIGKDSTDAVIKAQINSSSHRLGSGSTASQYGTGYLACMYLGAAVAAGVDSASPASKTDASSISYGLNLLLSEVISGSSLDKAISKLTGFTGLSDFQSKFNGGTAADLTTFVRGLLSATGNGLGGIATGNLADTDLAENVDLSGINLFNLNTDKAIVENVYPTGHVVNTGGTAKTDGTAPTDPEFKKLEDPVKNLGDFQVYGKDLSGITYDATKGELTVTGGGDIRITMKAGTPSTTQKIILSGGGTVILDGVRTTGDLIIKDDAAKDPDAKVNTLGVNQISNVSVEPGAKVTFSGDGQLKADTFASDATSKIACEGGAIIVGGGTGSMGAGSVTVDGGASVAANLTSVTNTAGAGLTAYTIARTKLPGLPNRITGISVGGSRADMLLNSTDPGRLWLDKKDNGDGTFGIQTVAFSGTNASGKEVSKIYSVQWNATDGEFKFNPYNVFTVAGGVEGTDWKFDEDKKVLEILTGTELTISGGTADIDGIKDYGTIKIKDGVSADLKLNNVQIDATKIGGNTAGIQLGNGGNVTLTMSGDNTITGSGEAAGIQVFGNYKRGGTAVSLEDSKLHIEMTTGSKLTATGGTVSSMGGAGIGAAWATDASKSSIEIAGEGELNTYGGNGGAGIGGSEGGNLGDISIAGTGTGLKITTVGGNHGAGIGAGGWVSNYNTPNTQVVGNITITGNVDIDASSKLHGTGIGSACHSKVHDITIGENPAGNPGVNDNLKINAHGGNDGAAIGSGWMAEMGNLVIWGGTINAESGTQGAGIGSGYNAKGNNGTITINGGKITAKGGRNSSGIGSGMDGSIDGIVINGGQITADGGWTYDGGNIGGYDKDGKEIKVQIADTDAGGSLSIKAGEKGEGLYNTTGSFQSGGDQVFALKVGYIDQLLKDGKIKSAPEGSTGLKFPLEKITATLDDGTTYEWDNLKHLDENDAFIWMKGKDITHLNITYKDDAGTPYTVDVPLIFSKDHGFWRYTQKEIDDEPPAKKPGFDGRPTPPVQDPDPEPTPAPEPEPEPEKPKGPGGIILQIGANYGETLEVPRFYLSAKALELNKVDISTQQNALDSMPVLRNAINRVSSIRGEYGALQNRLDHNQNDLSQAVENLTDAESRIRDADMAEEYTKLVKLNILQQSAQAMLSHSNQDASRVMQLFQ